MSDVQQESPETGRMRTSTRDLGVLRERMAAWLSGRLERPVTVSALTAPEGNGLSSETLIFDAAWEAGGAACVARMAPAADAMPVFPAYDLGTQFELMRLARERAGVPAPRALWFEPDPAHLGTPFFVMERLAGEVPPDMPPYTFGGWLHDAPAEERAGLQRRTVEIVARLHEMRLSAGELASLFPQRSGGGSSLRRHFEGQRAYYAWAHGGRPIPVLEAAFAWLEDHWPAEPGPDVLCWGDSRVGNVIYQDMAPAAVLDWEMATTGPRELDLGWMIFLHRFFQDIAEALELPGLPDFMRREDVCATYRELTGHQPRDMDFYEMYAALRHGVIMARIWQRRVHFGELPAPDDPDDLVIHRAAIERVLAG